MYKFLPILLFSYGLAVTSDEIYDNSYALIIGIDKYEYVMDLNYATNDAQVYNYCLLMILSLKKKILFYCWMNMPQRMEYYHH